MTTGSCFHCGLAVEKRGRLEFGGHLFCCTGCKTVYEILSAGGMERYYQLSAAPGTRPSEIDGKYDFLENEAIQSRLLDFREGDTAIVSLYVPQVHCSSCIWILENLGKLSPAIRSSQVNFPAKTVRIVYAPESLSLKELVELLCRIGYEPNISLDQYDGKRVRRDRSLIYRLGVAFFCFGNIMLLSFPEYFDVDETWLLEHRNFFRLLIFLLSLPSFLYSAFGYYRAAWSALRSKRLNIEVPIALGIIVMFVRSVFDMVFNHGPGFFDSLTALVFFMLLGRMFQAKTYGFLNFERDYKSYFPIAVTRILESGEENVPIYDIRPGDRLLLRNQELIPCDGILISDSASLDYSFVTGEANPVHKASGDRIFAGGRQVGGIIRMEALREVSQSYLTSLWSNQQEETPNRQEASLTNRLSRIFTPALLVIATAGFMFWSFSNLHTAFNVFTAVLIVACPCALALTAPFTLGNLLRILGRRKFYIKDAAALERLSGIDTIVFDKTGTITTPRTGEIRYDGQPLTLPEEYAIRALLRGSNHPLSRLLYAYLPSGDDPEVQDFKEFPGGGISGRVGNREIRLGSANFIGVASSGLKTQVHVEISGTPVGHFTFSGRYRPQMRELFENLSKRYELHLLSGDNEGERETLAALFPKNVPMHFNRKPDEKREYIANLQRQGKKVLMAGDGLNDAAALSQSDFGLAVSENVNLFSPACDAIVDAGVLGYLDRFLSLSRKSTHIIRISFGLSLLYNAVGLGFALSGALEPIVAAIIMPLSTVTIVSFTTLAGNFQAQRTGVSALGKSV